MVVLLASTGVGCRADRPRVTLLPPPADVVASFQGVVNSLLPRLSAELVAAGFVVDPVLPEWDVGVYHLTEEAAQRRAFEARIEVEVQDSAGVDPFLLNLEFASLGGTRWALLTDRGHPTSPMVTLEPSLLNLRPPRQAEDIVLRLIAVRIERGVWDALRSDSTRAQRSLARP